MPYPHEVHETPDERKRREELGERDANVTFGCMALLLIIALYMATEGYAYTHTVRSMLAAFGGG